MNTPPIIIEPSVSATYSVIWLHGLGADGHDFAGILPALNLPENHTIRFIFPHAPERQITVNNGMVMRGWYDVLSLELVEPVDEVGIEESVQSIQLLIRQEQEKGVAANQILLAGFSQGGVIALHAGLRFEEKIAGVMALSTYLPLVEKIPDGNLPILVAHGTHDPVVPLRGGEKARDALQSKGYAVDWHTYPMEHQVCAEEIDTIRDFLLKTLVT